jgi:hypothetical protein
MSSTTNYLITGANRGTWQIAIPYPEYQKVNFPFRDWGRAFEIAIDAP